MLATFGALADAWRRFKWVGQTREKELVAWLAIMLIGYLVSALSLHGAFIYMLFLQISLIVAARLIARSYAPLQLVQMDEGRRTKDERLLHREGAKIRQGRQGFYGSLPPSSVVGNHEQSIFPVQEQAVPERLDNVPLATSWLAAAEDALRRGDMKVARAMAEMALERDPYDEAAWAVQMRLRLADRGITVRATTVMQSHSAEAAGHEVGAMPEISPRFYLYWRSNGGLPIFGYPISPRFAEPDAKGNILQVQYFERARLEYHGERAGTPLEVMHGNLGRETTIKGSVAVMPPVGLYDEQVIYNAQGIGMPTPRKFYIFWECNGGPRIFGYPITPLLLGVDSNGGELAVQYFEKARLEYRPEHAGTIYGVQVSRLGVELFAGRYGVKG